MRRILATTLPLLALAGCALEPRPEQVRALRPIPTAATSGIVTGSWQGILERRGECLYLLRDHPRGPLRSLLVWPTGSRFDGRWIALPGPGRASPLYAEGHVEVTGTGIGWEPHILVNFPQLAPWRERCRADLIFVETIRTLR